MYLAPLRSPMEAEVRIATHDVGFVRPGDPVKIKLDTFNFVEHSMIEGTLRWISEGAFTTDDNGNPSDPYTRRASR
jgi:hemolysin D